VLLLLSSSKLGHPKTNLAEKNEGKSAFVTSSHANSPSQITKLTLE
jgi:hypothetical protein